MRRSHVYLIILVLLGLARDVYAVPTGLVVIPTTEVVSAGEYSIQPQLNIPAGEGAARRYYLNTEFGFGGRVESGVDFDLTSGARASTIWNLKYIVMNDMHSGRQLSLGVDGIRCGGRPISYVVFRQPFENTHGYLGLQRDPHGNHVFTGLAWAQNDRLILMADFTAGRDNFSSAGVNYEFTESFGMQVGVIFPNRGNATTILLLFEFGGSTRDLFR